MSLKSSNSTLNSDYYNGKNGQAGGMIKSPEKLYLEDNTDGEYFQKNGKYEKAKGLHWFVSGLFLVGDLAGGGLVAMPKAMIRFGFGVGLFFVTLVTLIATYTSHLLGRNWIIMQRRWPDVYASGHCRKPYPEMAQRSVGTRVRNFVSICINITQFGIAIVYLLLSARNIHSFLSTFFSINISFCSIVLIVALALLPVTFLKSPQDFWGVVVLGMFTTVFAVVLIVVGTALDYGTCSEHLHEPDVTASNYFLAFATFIFSYGGHAVFPTIQHDMRKPYEFTKSSVLAFGVVTSMYTPVCLLGYFTYGDSLRDSIIESVQTRIIQQTVNILITVHCILTLTIVFNPMNQEAEEHFNVPHHFCLKRILVRTGMMCAVVFVAESLPNFEPLLNLVGGSTLTFTSLVFPIVFNLLLETGEKLQKEVNRDSITYNSLPKGAAPPVYDDPEPTIMDIIRLNNKGKLIVCSCVLAFALIGGSMASVSAIKDLAFLRFEQPCYVSMFTSAGASDETRGLTACCGPYRNLSQFAHTPDEIAKFCVK